MLTFWTKGWRTIVCQHQSWNATCMRLIPIIYIFEKILRDLIALVFKIDAYVHSIVYWVSGR